MIFQHWNHAKRSHRGPTRHQGAPGGGGGAPRWLVGPLWLFYCSTEASWVCFLPEKIVKKFCCIWTSFDMDFLENQKQAKNGNWHCVLG